MSLTSCKNCGKKLSIDSINFCNLECSAQWNLLSEKFDNGLLLFNNIAQASRYYGKDRRTLEKWRYKYFDIDKTKISPDYLASNIKYVSCNLCGRSSPSAQCRTGYCKECSSKGLGKKQQGRVISERYKGNGNPNFVHGKGSKNFRTIECSTYREWREKILSRDSKQCRACSRKSSLHIHHVIPYALNPNLAFDVSNGITLCRFHHIELHRQLLDIQLLPTLYFLHIKGVQELHESLYLQPEFQALSQLPYKKYGRHELIRVVPRNYQKKLQEIHPQFSLLALDQAA